MDGTTMPTSVPAVLCNVCVVMERAWQRHRGPDGIVYRLHSQQMVLLAKHTGTATAAFHRQSSAFQSTQYKIQIGHPGATAARVWRVRRVDWHDGHLQDYEYEEMGVIRLKGSKKLNLSQI